jgi:hypothetical protein
MQQLLKKLPSALSVPQMRISSNGNLRQLATPVLTAPLTSPQSSSTPTATNGQTSPTPIPSLDGSDDSHASSTPAPQCDTATPSAEVSPAGVIAASPMPMKPRLAPTTPCSFDPSCAKQLRARRAQWDYNVPSAERVVGNVNLKLPSRAMPWVMAQAQHSSQAAVAIAQSLSPHMHLTVRHLRCRHFLVVVRHRPHRLRYINSR